MHIIHAYHSTSVVSSNPIFFWVQPIPLSPPSNPWHGSGSFQVLLRAVRDLALSPIHRAWAEDLVANAIAGSPAALSAEEAFQIYAELMKNLQPVPWDFF